MKRSRKFENVLDECLGRLLVKGETVEQCLQSFPEHADELKPLLETALVVKEASAIQPRPELRDKARYQFYSALQGMKPKKSRLVFGWQPLWATVVAIVLVFLLAGGGTVAAAAGSMPDEPLYTVKLATEQARLVLTPSSLGKAELYAKLADRRVLEIVRMAGEGKPEQIERTARRLDAYLTRIADLASTQEVADGEPRALLGKGAPAVKEAPIPEPALAVERAPLLPGRAEEGKKARVRVEHRARLRATVSRHAVNHPARLRTLLEKVPPSARPALLQAIAVSENGYEKALKSLD
ncbi:DUF5667 domain-containing protein [Chloroflexota bacterium]